MLTQILVILINIISPNEMLVYNASRLVKLNLDRRLFQSVDNEMQHNKGFTGALQVSISSTFYARLFHMKVFEQLFSTYFLALNFWRQFFIQKTRA